MKYIGKIKHMSVIKKFFGSLKTDEVIITDERIEHIKENHLIDYDLFEKHKIAIIEDPDLILLDSKNKNSIYMIKSIGETNINTIVKLILKDDNSNFKNSVITFYRIRNKNLEKLVKKSKVLYKNE